MTRYAHQTGHFVSRRFGWDCHGLPVEFEIDKALNITDRDQVLKMGVATYNMECRSIVQRYTAEWEKTVTRLGRWIDFENGYRTMDPTFMESVWWVFKTIFEKGLVYRGYKVMPYSTGCTTPLSNFEAGQNYKDVADVAIVVSFPIVGREGEYLIAWTTTPWTLPSNLALCVNEKFDYIKIFDKKRGKVFYLLEKRLTQIFPELNKDNSDEKRTELFDVLERMKGSQLVGLQYTPIFPYFNSITTAFRVVADNYVTEEGGTGIVHNAPGFGEDDYRVCMSNGIVTRDQLPCPVDANGRFTSEVTDFVGKYVKDADAAICENLKARGQLIVKENYMHSYPFCWRSETPLIYKAVPSWFVSVETVKAQLLENNLLTYWVPSFVQEKRFHNWLSDAKDWAISRNRFWGTPIPLWVSDDFEEMVAIGSIDELEQLSGVRVTDLHKEHVDHITIPSKQGKGVLRRIDEVFDCWFESGSMPYAQLHYPFENKDRFDNGFPADFIAEGLDQTRGWFYTLMVLSTCLFEKPAFKNLIVNGLVLASDGKKMSKRLKNYPDPVNIINNYGSDALRLYLINSPVVRAEVLKFQEEGVSDVLRNVLIPWFNAFRFFMQSVQRWERATNSRFVPTADTARSSKNDTDIWVLAAVMGLVKYVHAEMQAYRLYTVVPRLVGFIEELTNWYVRLNRDRLKGVSSDDADVQIGLSVLYEVMMTMTVMMAPFTPFFCEYLYQHLRKYHANFGVTDASVAEDCVGKASSVHFVLLPSPDDGMINEQAEFRFKVLQTAVQLIRFARDRRKIRNNLPLKNVLIVTSDEASSEALSYLRSYLLSEINAWDVTLSTDWKTHCALKTIPNWKDLGKRLGKDMKKVAAGISALTHEEILNFLASGTITICGHTFTKEDIVVRREYSGDTKKYEACVSDDGSVLVAVDTTCDQEVFDELRARFIGSSVQKTRKNVGLVAEDVVEVFYDDSEHALESAIKSRSELFTSRIKLMPLPKELMPSHALCLGTETFSDDAVSKEPIKFYLTLPTLSVSEEAVTTLCSSKEDAEIVTKYLSSMDYTRAVALPTVAIRTVNKEYVLKQGVHYFPTAYALFAATPSLQAKYPWVPVVSL